MDGRGLESTRLDSTRLDSTRLDRHPSTRWTRGVTTTARDGRCERADARVRSVSVVRGVGAGADRCRRRRKRWMSARSIGRRIDGRRAGTSRGCDGRWSDRGGGGGWGARAGRARVRVMHHAARSGSVECVETCVALGAGADARTRAGNATPLHKACAGGHAEVVRVLLRAGSERAGGGRGRGDASAQGVRERGRARARAWWARRTRRRRTRGIGEERRRWKWRRRKRRARSRRRCSSQRLV